MKRGKLRLSKMELFGWAAAGIVCILVVLQRNGSLERWAASAGARSSYLSFETAVLGAPEIDTPRGIRQFLEQLAERRRQSDTTE